MERLELKLTVKNDEGQEMSKSIVLVDVTEENSKQFLPNAWKTLRDQTYSKLKGGDDTSVS